MKNRIIKRGLKRIIESIIFLIIIDCNYKLIAQNEKIELDKFNITYNSSLDSINFSFEGRILPKAMHRKASITIQPILIFNSDSIKFPTAKLIGEFVEYHNDDMYIAYEAGGTFKFSKMVQIPSGVKNGVAKIIISGNNKFSSSLCNTFEKEFKEE